MSVDDQMDTVTIYNPKIFLKIRGSSSRIIENMIYTTKHFGHAILKKKKDEIIQRIENLESAEYSFYELFGIVRSIWLIIDRIKDTTAWVYAVNVYHFALTDVTISRQGFPITSNVC